MPVPTTATDFVDGLKLWAGNGDAATQNGCAIYLYAANRSMDRRVFSSADGEWLLIPQLGRLRVVTELGRMDLEPQQIAVIPRGIRWQN